MILAVGTGHASVTTAAWERLIFYLARSAFAPATNKTSQPQHQFSTGCARRSLIPQLLYFLGLPSRIQLNGLPGAQLDSALKTRFGAFQMISGVGIGPALVIMAALQRLTFSVVQSVFARAMNRMSQLRHLFSTGFAPNSPELQIFKRYQIPPRLPSRV
jgi:hypothetical protein